MKEWPSNNDKKMNLHSNRSLKIVEMEVFDGKHSLLQKEEETNEFEENANFWAEFCQKYKFNPIRGIDTNHDPSTQFGTKIYGKK